MKIWNLRFASSRFAYCLSNLNQGQSLFSSLCILAHIPSISKRPVLQLVFGWKMQRLILVIHFKIPHPPFLFTLVASEVEETNFSMKSRNWSANSKSSSFVSSISNCNCTFSLARVSKRKKAANAHDASNIRANGINTDSTTPLEILRNGC